MVNQRKCDYFLLCYSNAICAMLLITVLLNPTGVYRKTDYY